MAQIMAMLQQISTKLQAQFQKWDSLEQHLCCQGTQVQHILQHPTQPEQHHTIGALEQSQHYCQLSTHVETVTEPSPAMSTECEKAETCFQQQTAIVAESSILVHQQFHSKCTTSDRHVEEAVEIKEMSTASEKIVSEAQVLSNFPMKSLGFLDVRPTTMYFANCRIITSYDAGTLDFTCNESVTTSFPPDRDKLYLVTGG